MPLREITRNEFLKVCPQVRVSGRAAVTFWVAEPYYGVVEKGPDNFGFYLFKCLDGVARPAMELDGLTDPEYAMRGRIQELMMRDATPTDYAYR